MRLETLAVSKLMERMVNNGASLEELKKGCRLHGNRSRIR